MIIIHPSNLCNATLHLQEEVPSTPDSNFRRASIAIAIAIPEVDMADFCEASELQHKPKGWG